MNTTIPAMVSFQKTFSFPILCVRQLFKRMHFRSCLRPFISMLTKATAVVKSHFWLKIIATTSPKKLKTKTISLTFYFHTFLRFKADNFHCFSSRSETYYKIVQQIVEFRWLI